MVRLKKLFLTVLLLLVVAGPALAEGHLVVLMYHRFDAGVTISTPMESFKRQINYLKDNDYHFVTMDELREHLANNEPFPEKSVMITIDDGFKSTYTKAYPFLKKKGVPWVFYPYTQAIEEGYGSSVTWPMVREMANDGVDVDNHSYSHGKFIYDDLNDTWVQRELTGPHRLLREKTGQESQSFAIPYGMYDREFIDVLRRETDYDVAFHIDPGVVDPRSHDFLLPRFGVNRHTSWEEFKQKLNRLHLAVRSADPKRGARLETTPDTVSVTLENPERVEGGPINVFISEFRGALDWHWAEDGRTIVAEVPGEATEDWNRVIVTAYDDEHGKYRYYSHGMVFE
jgi:biofilm PGA synthesis lipoprotein PgaB